MNSTVADRRGSKVPALAKGFAVLELVAREPGLSFTAIQSRLGLAKSSAHHLLSALVALGAVKSREDGFVLGLRVVELAGIASGAGGLEPEALPYLRVLARDAQLTCHLGVLDGHEAVYMARVECDSEIRVNSWVGKRFALNSSALGKVLVAELAPERLEEVLALVPFERRTPATITDTLAFSRHLAVVRGRGWALDDEEDAPGKRCVAAPIRDRGGRVVAAVSAVGTVSQIDDLRVPLLAAQVCEAAADIGRAAFDVRSEAVS